MNITPKDDLWIITHRNNIENITYDTLAGKIMHIDLATGKILGAMESPVQVLAGLAAPFRFISGLVAMSFSYSSNLSMQGTAGSTEGLKPNN